MRYITLLTAISILACSAQQAWAAGNVLKGQIETKSVLDDKNKADHATHKEKERQADPFSSDDSGNDNHSPGQTGDNSPTGGPDTSWMGQPDTPSPGLSPPDTPAPGLTNPLTGAVDTDGQPVEDPDDTPEMRLAWDSWHRRVAEAIFTRFNTIAQAAFKFSPPLVCRVSYEVTVNGQVRDIRMNQKSGNMMFNLLIMTVLKSVNGDKELLKFPEGSHRTLVAKEGVFLQNYGRQGFRHTIGDSETIRTR